MHKLKEASKYYKFEKLPAKDMTMGDELILLKFLDVQDTSHQHKIVESLRISNMNLVASLEFSKQLELIKNFNPQKDNQKTNNITKFVIKSKYCGK